MANSTSSNGITAPSIWGSGANQNIMGANSPSINGGTVGFDFTKSLIKYFLSSDAGIAYGDFIGKSIDNAFGRGPNYNPTTTPDSVKKDSDFVSKQGIYNGPKSEIPIYLPKYDTTETDTLEKVIQDNVAGPNPSSALLNSPEISLDFGQNANTFNRHSFDKNGFIQDGNSLSKIGSGMTNPITTPDKSWFSSLLGDGDGFLGSDMSGKEVFDVATEGLKALTGLYQAYQGKKDFKLSKESFDFNKSLAQTNLENQATLVNNQIRQNDYESSRAYKGSERARQDFVKGTV